MNNYVHNNSIIHKLNPIIKVIIFLLIAVLIFLKTDFLIQIILMILSIGAFFAAKLSFKTFRHLMLIYLVTFIILGIINFVGQKNPLVITAEELATAKVLPTKIEIPHNYAWAGDLYGGAIVTDHQNPNFALIFNITPDPSQNIFTVVRDYINQWAIQNNFYNSHPGFSVEDLKISIIDRVESATAATETNHTQLVHAIGYFMKPYGLSQFAWISAFYVSNKILMIVIASTILTFATSTIELTYAFENLLRPLKLIRFPVNELAMIISVALRFIPSLISESFRIMNAQASRGIDFRNGKFFEKISSIVSLIVPLFTIAFIKADDLANAMTARSYNPRYKRSQFRTFSLHSGELIMFGLFVIFMTIAYHLTSNSFVFGPLGLANYLIVLGI
ncbi:energy-coupling factor transport system permease protein [Mycoplasmoides fastidiosum]|uniref:Energy-coupling factor transport system permease protein n=1 Tax=Mycoplasmoides fastidiosum TaxID=92758 RepID=A0ABU0M055_9BACT|nr:energy-coupling factor transporter transmembrane component T [Mycoplasmoides fastidiosum]MDQ0514324.1 energy-coupling factor transport system permease protein [Mycoplasmoides fastidiosum]UUD38073.1 energy-coupling factor transporter transmembrane protein EcfT [Mycoplasmoides fastidiosum]